MSCILRIILERKTAYFEMYSTKEVKYITVRFEYHAKIITFVTK